MRYILLAGIVIFALIAVVLIVGSLLPKKHRVVRTAQVNLSPDRLWQVVADVGRYSEWRDDVKQVELLPDSGGKIAWRETYRNGDSIPFEFQESDRPSRLVVRITDPNLPFGGIWIYEISPRGEGSELTITEDGFVSNPVFRFISYYFINQSKTLETYLAALGRVASRSVTANRN